MPGIKTLAVLIALAAGAAAPRAGAADATLKSDLERVAQRSIYFGHQSVGENLLDGLRDLALEAGVPLRIAEARSASALKPGTFGHTFVAENGDPLRKLRSFEQAMGPQPAPVDIAFVKFCYVDIDAATDAKALFGRYRAAIDGLRAKHPGTTFVHVTLPLTEEQGGARALAKRLLGRAPGGTIENLRREEYNALLRRAYAGREPLFDLARVESTAPDGSAVRVQWNGREAPALAAAYTDDGGHLNAVGRRRAARELVSVLAAIRVKRAQVAEIAR
jgi:lysophospholipase L1-like esterase